VANGIMMRMRNARKGRPKRFCDYGEGDHNRTGDSPLAAGRPAKCSAQFRDDQPEGDIGAEHAEFLEHGQIANAGLFTLILGKSQADVLTITGFIEPHFLAGFSSGPKSIMPA
jgi:hypothetical protein